MTDLEPILALWSELEAAGADYVLATVAAVTGSSYRRPGARMLLAQDGRRAGTVSGGCLEAEVSKRAWWLTEKEPVVEQFSTFEDDGERPYGSGCGGLVSILLERRETAALLLAELHRAFTRREPLAIATALEGLHIGQHVFAPAAEPARRADAGLEALRVFAQQAAESRASSNGPISLDGETVRAWADFRPARPGIWIFGAGDDARPLLQLAKELGWFVAVADGRSHLASRTRFARADETAVLDIAALPGAQFARLDIHPTDAIVVMTHSFEQDSRVLASLLSLDARPAYIGVLGPQRRTRELLVEAARLLNCADCDEQAESWLASIHAPTGLDLNADTPASIALSILAEIQQALNHGTGRPLRLVRGASSSLAHAQ
jgi:xanthine dehydrogenase accessory factor